MQQVFIWSQTRSTSLKTSGIPLVIGHNPFSIKHQVSAGGVLSAVPSQKEQNN
jgi:hypothetical protein